MNTTPNQNYNVIKGLQIFINDIRECTTREAESKRVESELDKIRKKFNSTSALTGYEKKKCVWKLLYIYILGYKIDFGHNYACDLITSIKYSEKMAGYIAMSILFRESNTEIDIMINSIRNDLFNRNAFSQSMALTLATNLGNPELIEALSENVYSILENPQEKQPYIIKKAMICMGKIVKVKKELHNSSRLAKCLMKIVDIKNFECVIAGTGLLFNLIYLFGSTGYETVVMKVLNNILYCFIEKKKDCPDEYVYYHIKAPWVQIKILKILQLCNPSILDTESINNLKEYVDYFGRKTMAIVNEDKKFQRFYAEYCIFFEVVNVIDHYNLKMHFKVFDTCVNILGAFLQDDQRKHPNKDINTKYLALDGMAKLSKYTNGNKILKDHSTIILQSLRDADVSIRRRALDLLFLTCTQESVKLICKELLIYLKEDEPQLKEDITLKVAILSEKYATDYFWYIDVCIKMLELAGDFVSDDIIYRIVQIVTGFENKEPDPLLQIHACEKVIALLKKDYAFESVVRLAALLLGEYGHLVTKKSEMEKQNNIENQTDLDFEVITLTKLADLLWKHASVCSAKTIYCILNCMIKFVNNDIKMRDYAIPQFEQYLESWDPELQQRAIEYIILSKLDNEMPDIPNMSQLRANLFAPMPVYSQDFFNNSLLMKKLQKTQTGLYTNKEAKVEQKKENKPTEAKGNIKNASTLLASSSDVIESTGNPYAEHELYIKDPNGFAVKMNKNPQFANLIDRNQINNFDMFKSMLTSNNSQGVIYSDPNSIKVSLMIKRIDKGTLGYIFAFSPFTSGNERLENIDFSLSNYTTSELLNIQISKVKYDQVPHLMMKVQSNDAFSTPPIVELNATLGMTNISAQFSLPLLITKFLDPYDTTVENYTPLWYEFSNAIEDNYHKMDAIMYNPMVNSGKSIMDFLKKLGLLMQNLGFKVFAPEDRNNFHEIEGCAMLNTKEVSIPILFQASFLPSLMEEFRFSLRCKTESELQYSSLLLDIYAVVKMWVNPQ